MFKHCVVLLYIFPESNTEFLYGDCRPDLDIKFYAHIHLTNDEVTKKAIVRGWLDIPRVPTCIRVRGTFYEEDMFRSTAYNFQMCTPVITYIHDKTRYRYFYYEWYLPDEELSGVDWDLYFYGPPGQEWGLLKYKELTL